LDRLLRFVTFTTYVLVLVVMNFLVELDVTYVFEDIVELVLFLVCLLLAFAYEADRFVESVQLVPHDVRFHGLQRDLVLHLDDSVFASLNNQVAH